MARPREFDTDTAIADISNKFWSDGYETTGITDLVEATGVARASLYGAFGSKSEMLHRAIDHYLENEIEQIVRSVDVGGLDAISGWFRKFAWVREHKPEVALRGCLVVNSIVELGSSDPVVVELSERYRDRIRHAFRTALQQAHDDGDFAGDIEETTELALLMLMGLYINIKSGVDLDQIKRLSAIAAATVDTWRRDQDREPEAKVERHEAKRAAMAQNIETTTGRTIADWGEIVADAPVEGFMERVRWLTQEHELGHFQARRIVEELADDTE